MPRFERDAYVARPLQEVFQLLSDPEQIRSWVPEITELSVLGGGPVAAGSTLSEVRRVGGKAARTELRVREYEPPRRYAVENVTSGVTSAYTYTLEAEGDGTRVRLDAEVSAGGFRAPIAAVTALILERQDGKQLEKLKAAAESRA